MDLFVVPTIGFDLLYAFVIVRLGRRDLVWINVTANPTAEWVARQITEAFPWDEAPRYLIRDRDRIYSSVVTRRLRSMGIRDRPTAPASPWQNGFAERLIGSIRRECVDHIIVLGEMHLRRVLNPTPTITIASERIDHWTRMLRSLAKFSESEASNHAPSLADFITTMVGFNVFGTHRCHLMTVSGFTSARALRTVGASRYSPQRSGGLWHRGSVSSANAAAGC
jgi:transposase InsO family protein